MIIARHPAIIKKKGGIFPQDLLLNIRKLHDILSIVPANRYHENIYKEGSP